MLVFVIVAVVPLVTATLEVEFEAEIRSKFGYNIVFDEVIMNRGSAYYPTNGSFVAPVPGGYIFSVSVSAYQHTDLTLAKNGQIIERMFFERMDSETQYAVAELQRGDVVTVKPGGSYGLAFYEHWNTICSFHGVLATKLK